MAQAERQRKLKDDISTISNDLQSILKSINTSAAPKTICEEVPDLSRKATCVDLNIVSFSNANPVSERLNKVEKINKVERIEKTETEPETKSQEKKRVKVLKPIKEEDQASAFICVSTYKAIFK